MTKKSLLILTWGISGFSSVFIQFCCGAVCTEFTLLEFAREFEFNIGFLSLWSSVWCFLPHDSWRHVNFEIQSLTWWFFDEQLKQSFWLITNYLRLETSLFKNSKFPRSIYFVNLSMFSGIFPIYARLLFFKE